VSPGWLNDVLGMVMIAISVNFAGRLVLARRWHRQIHVEVNIAELVMGVAMAGMLLPDINVFPTAVWVIVFVGFTLWFLIENARFVKRHGISGGDPLVGYYRAHYPLHVLMSCSMLYMYLATSPPAASGSMMMSAPEGATAEFTFLPLLFAVLLCGFAVWQLDGINRFLPTGAVVSGVDEDLVTVPSGSTGTLATGAAGGPSTFHQRDWLAPRVETVCLIAMSVTMAILLARML
jgi:hypothetical protein